MLAGGQFRRLRASGLAGLEGGLECGMDAVQVTPIARVATPYKDKFGVPRQAGLVPSAQGRLVFEPPFRREEAVRGLEEYSHLWIVFLFDQVKEDEARLSVRPPRLGGNEKVGVFATRSPFRPNRLGLSVCKLEGIDRDCGDGPVLRLSGVDMVDGTAVLDVKPYLPYADQVAQAQAGLAPAQPERIEVVVAEEVQEEFGELPTNQQEVILESLQWDARPAFHEGARTYYLRVFDRDVAWEVRDGQCVVTGVVAVNE